jgi:hypothetical protein
MTIDNKVSRKAEETRARLFEYSQQYADAWHVIREAVFVFEDIDAETVQDPVAHEAHRHALEAAMHYCSQNVARVRSEIRGEAS